MLITLYMSSESCTFWVKTAPLKSYAVLNATWIRISKAFRQDGHYLDSGHSRRSWLWQRSGRDFTSDQRRESSLWWDWGGVQERKGSWVLFREQSKYFRSYFQFHSECQTITVDSRRVLPLHKTTWTVQTWIFFCVQRSTRPSHRWEAAFGS